MKGRKTNDTDTRYVCERIQHMFVCVNAAIHVKRTNELWDKCESDEHSRDVYMDNTSIDSGYVM